MAVKLKHSIPWLVAACGFVFVAGCGGTYDASVEGVVTLDGKPLPLGMVTFHPSSPGPPAYAIISEDGSYAVNTGRETGLPSGEYHVSVIANEPPAIAQTASGGAPPLGKPITPAWYRMKETSGLQYKVEPGSNEINIELTSQPPAGWKPRG
jgi:hypothetical protein